MTDDELAEEFEIGRGAVLYNDRDDAPTERDLHHVTRRFYDVDTDRHYYRVSDGTYTLNHVYAAEDLLEDFAPAGWQWPVGRKPTYHLTRECGVDDSADLMTDGGTEVRRVRLHRENEATEERPDGIAVRCPFCDRWTDSHALIHSGCQCGATAQAELAFEQGDGE